MTLEESLNVTKGVNIKKMKFHGSWTPGLKRLRMKRSHVFVGTFRALISITLSFLLTKEALSTFSVFIILL